MAPYPSRSCGGCAGGERSRRKRRRVDIKSRGGATNSQRASTFVHSKIIECLSGCAAVQVLRAAAVEGNGAGAGRKRTAVVGPIST